MKSLREILAPLGALCLAGSLAACAVEDPEPEVEARRPAPASAPAPELWASVPAEGYLEVDPERLERERLDDSWRGAAEVDRTARAAAGADGGADGAVPAAAGGDAPVERMRAVLAESPAPPAGGAGGEGGAAPAAEVEESWDDIGPEAFADLEPRLPLPAEGGGPTVLALQWMLDRVRFSPGVVDGRWGKNTEKAVYWLQDSLGLEPTGTPDRPLWELLAGQVGAEGPLRRYAVTAADLEGPFVEIPEDHQERAELDCLCHGSPAEALAERFHTTRDLLAQVNPQVDWEALTAGTELWVPAVEEVAEEPGAADRVERIVVSKDGYYLHALDAAGRVLYHFPTTVGDAYDSPSPTGELTLTGIAYRPDYHFQPRMFEEVPDDEPDVVLPPGPNSPVGLVWMQLSEDGYGVHGTASPETIGYATSHGCVRLTNWDALYLANRTSQGTPVELRGG